MKVHLLLLFLFGILNAFAFGDKHEEESEESSEKALKFLKRSAKNYEFGPRLAKRIVRGKKAKKHEFPWIASIKYKGYGHTCGGSLFHPKFVLTAGHCLRWLGPRNSTNYQNELPNYYVVLGDHSLTTIEPNEQRFSIENLIALDTDTNRLGVPHLNDLAVIKLNGTANINDYVSTISLPNPSITISPNDKITVAGWGMYRYQEYDADLGVKSTGPSSVLRKTHVRVIRNEDCTNFYSKPKDENGNEIKYGQKAGEDIICTREEPGEGRLFYGDSGSPGVYYDPITKKHFQVGIFSYHTGRLGEEGFTNVSYFLDDINAMKTDLGKN